eukprot:745947-Alexandrium_andersonii.AAC.1
MCIRDRQRPDTGRPVSHPAAQTPAHTQVSLMDDQSALQATSGVDRGPQGIPGMGDHLGRRLEAGQPILGRA